MTPKAETDYEKKIREAKEKQMMDCCGNGSRQAYDQYGYKPHPKKPISDSPVDTESAHASEEQPVILLDKKNSKR